MLVSLLLVRVSTYPCMLRLIVEHIISFVLTASRNHSWFEEMAGPAMLRIDGEAAFVLVLVKATLYRLCSVS